MIDFGVIHRWWWGFSVGLFFPPALSRPFIGEEIGIDLHQIAKKQSNHIKEIKGKNTMGLALTTSPGKQSRSVGVSVRSASVFPWAVSLYFL